MRNSLPPAGCLPAMSSDWRRVAQRAPVGSFELLFTCGLKFIGSKLARTHLSPGAKIGECLKAQSKVFAANQWPQLAASSRADCLRRPILREQVLAALCLKKLCLKHCAASARGGLPAAGESSHDFCVSAVPKFAQNLLLSRPQTVPNGACLTLDRWEIPKWRPKFPK